MYKFIAMVIFAGSIFLTSGKFIQTQSSPKFYFVLLIMLSIVSISVITRKQASPNPKSTIENILYGILTICFLQSLYGLYQFFTQIPTDYQDFSISGSFENPSGFAAVLSISFPIGLFLLKKSNRIRSCLLSTLLLTIGISIFLSGSRTGVISVLISSTFFALFCTNILIRLRQFNYRIQLYIVSLSLLFLLLSLLYFQKKDSANGRLLIWKVSAEMIKDKPIFGHGYGTFKGKYMNYQAQYFKNNPNSKYCQLADNVKNPFNEFILLTVEFGLVGLVLFCLFIYFFILRIKKSDDENRFLSSTGFISLLTFACFSYPLQYIAVWLLLVFYISILLPKNIIEFKSSTFFLTIRTFVFITVSICLMFLIRQINAELKWKEIAIKSLSGKTREMLPEYEKLYPRLSSNPLFLYNYGAELNIAGKYTESIEILLECQNLFNDYDLQLLLANNYQEKENFMKAIQTLENASNMIPCRFVPLYQLFKIYIETEQKEKSEEIAKRIISKKVKVDSPIIAYIKKEAKEYLDSISHSKNTKAIPVFKPKQPLLISIDE